MTITQRFPVTSFLFMTSVVMLTRHVTPTTATFGFHLKYDFIVVGAGSAGSVVASRLSEIDHVSVLLLEAGSEHHVVPYVLSAFPAAAPLLPRTAFDWQYKSVAQTGGCQSMVGHRCVLTRGKALGGTSRINYMMYVRGNRDDYNRWARLGNPGWSYNDVLPYFLKSEDNTDPKLSKTKYHSTGGLLTVSNNNYNSKLVEPFLQSAVENKFKICDVNGASQMCFSKIQGTVKGGQRMHTGKAFLTPAQYRSNLHIVQGAHVQKIRFNKNKVANGVQYIKNGVKIVARASKEVIISAGAIGSPQLLMLSGIGPKDQLEKFAIKPVAILPGVGENLMDHYGTGALMFTANDRTTFVGYRDLINPVPGLILLIKWFFFGKGFLTTLGAMEATGFIKTNPQLTNSPNWPDAQILFDVSTIAFSAGFRLKQNFGFTDTVWNKYFRPLAWKDSFTIWLCILHPKSRGTVRLRSKNPNVHPDIDPEYFSHPDDIKAIVSSMKQMLRFANSEAFKPYGVKLHNITYPGCEHYLYLSDNYLECLARGFTATFYHYSGTCKMGPNSDPQAVVDAKLRVRNVRGLRVVDASIVPYVTSGNTNTPAIMIGEKASDLIKQAYGLRPPVKVKKMWD